MAAKLADVILAPSQVRRGNAVYHDMKYVVTLRYLHVESGRQVDASAVPLRSSCGAPPQSPLLFCHHVQEF